MKIPNLLLVCFFVLLFAACEKDESNGTKEDSHFFNVSLVGGADNASLSNLPAAECVLEFEIGSSTRWSLSVPEWAVSTVMSGTEGNQNIKIVVTANTSTQSRSGSIVFTHEFGIKTIEITQRTGQGGDDDSAFEVKLLTANVSLSNLPSTECTLEFEISSKWNWILSVPVWAVSTTTSGTESNQVIAIVIKANETSESRSGNIVFNYGYGYKIIDITQGPMQGGDGDESVFEVEFLTTDVNISNLPATECAYVFSVNSSEYWTLTVPEWTYSTEQSGVGLTPRLVLIVSANDSISPRTGKMVFSYGTRSKTIEITQQGKPEEEVPEEAPTDDTNIDDIIVEPVNPF